MSDQSAHPRPTRRDFLKATLIVAGATGADCADDPNDTADTADAGVDTGGDAGTDTTIGPDAGQDAGADADAPDGGSDAPIVLDASRFPQGIASGDPSFESIVLWARAPHDGDLSLALELATDEAFTERVLLDGAPSRALLAEARFDHCVKALVTGLAPGSTYFYRFVVQEPVGGERASSRIARTKTAPAADADVPARFAFVSCQDFNGRYYNPYERLLVEDPDFVVHLGDYIYETSADPVFQQATPERSVTLTDTEGAITLGSADAPYYAARSLSNYREIYQTYRGDALLQRVHERFPMVVIWDDHEFADDAFGASATATDGREDEEDVTRRKNANQAWWEYMPARLRAGDAFEYDPNAAWPGDLDIYRDVRWGANLHLVLTDLRQYRPDHVVREDGFPASVLMTESELLEQEGELPSWAEPYVNPFTYADGAYLTLVEDALDASGEDPALASSLLTLSYINDLLLAQDENATPITDDLLPRGLAYRTLGKSGRFSQIGSRYLAIRDPYEAYAAYRFAESGGASEDMLGSAQEAWFLETMQTSDATWKVWGNEFCLVPRVVDITDFALPPAFAQRFLLSAEDWDGSPNKRDELLAALADVGNVVAITGDIHAFFAGVPGVRGRADARIVEFVTGAISSAPYQTLLINQANSDPTLREVGAAALALLVKDLLLDTEKATNPHLAHADLDRHGFATVDVTSEDLTTTFYSINKAFAGEPIADADVATAFETTTFQVRDGAPVLYRDADGVWERWDVETLSWAPDNG